MSITKEERERLVFGLFAQAAHLVPLGSFQSRQPPEPDILYIDALGEMSAFELVEILDRDFSSSIGRQLGTKDLCESHLNSLSNAEQDAFRSKFSNANIFLGFHNSLSMQRRRNELPALFTHLFALPDGFAGDLLDEGESPNIERVSVHRGRFVGPLFDTPSVVSVGDPTVEAIRSKLRKSYSAQGCLKLLAYIDGNPMLPDEVWLDELDQFLEGLDSSCQFKEIFVYDCQSNTVKRQWRAA